MRWNKEGWGIQQLEENGQTIPSWAQECPDIPPGKEWLLSAFWDLSTERQIGFSEGPIPRSAIKRYADEFRLSPRAFRVLELTTRVLDGAFMKWNAAERESASKRDAPPPSVPSRQKR